MCICRETLLLFVNLMPCEWNVRRSGEAQRASSRIPPTIYRGDDHGYPVICSGVTKDCDTDGAKGRGDIEVGYNWLQYEQQYQKVHKSKLSIELKVNLVQTNQLEKSPIKACGQG